GLNPGSQDKAACPCQSYPHGVRRMNSAVVFNDVCMVREVIILINGYLLNILLRRIFMLGRTPDEQLSGWFIMVSGQPVRKREAGKRCISCGMGFFSAFTVCDG
ncbi:hypothetical protein, partial [Akkermansia sp.]|uniref:hypothetical protein n=1 Tax=Akkermansia sp. TaxID=1872421 RepID=UPI003AAC6B70